MASLAGEGAHIGKRPVSMHAFDRAVEGAWFRVTPFQSWAGQRPGNVHLNARDPGGKQAALPARVVQDARRGFQAVAV